MSPEQQLRDELQQLLSELSALRAEMKQMRALLKGDAVALETLLRLAREHADLENADTRLQ